MKRKKRIVSFGHMGDYYIAAKPLVQLFGDEVLPSPPITKKTIEKGLKHSPESVCIPFKYNLGNFIESLDKGANVLLQVGGGCRMGYYGEVQKEILKKLGYEFEFYKLVNSHNVIAVSRDIKRIMPGLSYVDIAKAFWISYHKAQAIDEIDVNIRTNIGFEVKKGSFENLYKSFLIALDQTDSVKKVKKMKQEYAVKFQQLEIDKPENPIKVGIVGEIYIVMEPFSNFFVEKQLAKYGIEVHRFISVTGIIHHSFNYDKHIKHLVKKGFPYLTGALGAHGTESVSKAHELAKSGFDGLIHVKPFGCMPEVNAMSALYRISKDYKFPILYFSFDELASETGVKTRLEAFYDMLVMKKRRIHGKAN
ncbi:hypothetical protein ACFL1P_00575 [Patescibacteria group bacterium]